MRFDEISDMNATVSSSVIRDCDVVNRSSGFYPRVVTFCCCCCYYLYCYGLRFCDFNGL